MQLYLGLYEGSFKEMVLSMLEAGLNEESGHLGKLISSADNIFELVSTAAAVQLQNSLLTMRQYERSFIDNPLAEYSDAMLEEKAVLETLLEASGLDEDTQLFIRGDLDTYAESFLAYGEAVRQLTKNRDTFSDVTLEFTPIMDNLRATQSSKKQLGNRIELRNKSGFFLSLSQGVNELMTAAEQVIQDTVLVLSGLAQGDLTHTMNGDFDGVFAKLKTDVNSTVQKLTEVVSNIQNGARSVNKVASEIATSNAEVSMRTEQQAAVLEETASAMEEMTAIVRQTAANTVEANKLANAARTQAEAGGDIVSNAVSATNDISQSSNQISNIIGVIDEISFQTNLLALNAAVEAARAGEQGRGFAVVADEVRQLAAHSANAAKEIKELIDHSNKQVQRGSELVNKSGEALTEIVKAVKQVTTIISEIAVASQEQADGIAQVNVSIANMDEGTQQNAAMVEQVKSASDSMGEEAQRLNVMMDFFKLDMGRGGTHRLTRH
jgi:methyl-accepting chemotaxis protein